MPVSFAFRLTVLAAACAALSACSSLNHVTGRIGGLVTPYKVEVVQGNFVSKEQKDALQVGMPRAQVRDILGSPLVTSVFHADRWEYVFTIRRQGQEPQQRKLTVFFRGDELVKVESDEMISEDQFVASLSAGRRLGKVPLLEVPPEVLREFGLQNTARAPAGAAAPTVSAAAPTRYPPLEAPGALTSAWDASTQRAVAASAASRTAAVSASSAPLLPPPAPTPPSAAASPAPAASPAAARPSAPAVAVAPAPAAVVAPVAVAPAPVAQVSPAPAPLAAVAAPAPAPATLVPVPGPVASPTRVAPAPIAAPAAATAPVNANPAPLPVTSTATRPSTAAVLTTPSPPPPTGAPVEPASTRGVPAASVQVAPGTVAAAPAISPAPIVSSAAPATSPRAPSANTLAAADPDIISFLNRWSSDWQSRNATAYFTHYLPEFKGSSATRAEWEALRRSRIEGRTRISVGLFDVRVRMVTPTEARLVFRQVYESDTFNEIGLKAMFLVKRDGRWFIEREFFTPAQ